MVCLETATTVCSIIMFSPEAAHPQHIVYTYLVPVAKIIQAFKRVMISLVDKVRPSWNAARMKNRMMDTRRVLVSW